MQPTSFKTFEPFNCFAPFNVLNYLNDLNVLNFFDTVGILHTGLRVAKSAVVLNKLTGAFFDGAITTAARREVGDAAIFLQWIVGSLRNP